MSKSSSNEEVIKYKSYMKSYYFLFSIAIFYTLKTFIKFFYSGQTAHLVFFIIVLSIDMLIVVSFIYYKNKLRKLMSHK